MRGQPAANRCRRFEGSRVLITGAGHGIGRACALRLAAEGAAVAVADLDEPAARATVELLAGATRHAALRVDVTDQRDVAQTVDTAAARLGGLDTVISVAGADIGRVLSPDEGDWMRMLSLNLLGAVRCLTAAERYLRASRGAAVVISSVNAIAPFGSVPYSAAKAGLGPVVSNLAQQWAPAGVRVNTVAPATIRTRVWNDRAGGADRVASLYPLGRVGEPEDVAAAVAFLASSDAAWITGQTLAVDGGILGSIARPFLELSDDIDGSA